MVVIDIAMDGGSPATRKPAEPVSGADVIGERVWRSIDPAAEVEQVAGHRIGNQPAPGGIAGEFAGNASGDRSVADEFAGVVCEAEQCRGIDDDLHLDADASVPAAGTGIAVTTREGAERISGWRADWYADRRGR